MKAEVNLHKTLEEIRQKVGNRKATSYTREGCRVSMANIPSERVVLDVDLVIASNEKNVNKCDLVLFYIDPIQNCLIGVPMELKSGDVKASVVTAQLREGARIVDNFTPRNIEIDLIPILVHDGIDKAQYERLRLFRIRFRGDEYPINTTTCGYQGNIAQALSKSTKR